MLKIRKFFKKFMTILICVSMTFILLIPNAATPILNISDSDTMDTYQDVLINNENGAKYAGRIWTDKSVFTNNIKLDMQTDGYDGTVTNNSDFLHAFSILGSSQAWIGLPPTRTVIVIDNSGSMYGGSNNEWEGTRVYKVVTAVNNSIETLMKAGKYNEVAVVLFGDGLNGRSKEDSNNTHSFHGNSTAVTILPMKHYSPSETGEVKEYLKAGWNKELADENGDSPNHKDYVSSGFIFVDNELAGINKKDIDNNKQYNWFSQESDEWNGWNDCGNKKYTSYANGTTNIQAGFYQGATELLNAPKTIKISDIESQYVPSLILMTDGAITDALGNWLNPEMNKLGQLINSTGFVNDFSNKGTSFVKRNDVRGTENKSSAWNQFLLVKNSDGTDVQSGIQDEVELAKKGEIYYELFASADLDKNQHLSFDGYEIKESEEQSFYVTEASNSSLKSMEKLANAYRDDEAYFVFGYLLTASYFKQAIKEEYNLEKDWDVYTITVDMDDPSKNDFKAGYPSNEDYLGNNITTNPFVMNPEKYFNQEWLKEKGFLKDSSSDINNTFYEDETVGDKTVEGIVKAINAWDAWTTGNWENWNEKEGFTSFQSFQSGYNFQSNKIKNRIKVYGKGEYYLNGELGSGNLSAYELNDTNLDPESGLTKEQKFNSNGVFPGPNHNNFFRVYASEELNIPTTAENYNINLQQLDYDYVTEAYYASSSTADEANESINKIFEEIADKIKEPAFIPVNGINDVSNSNITYSDPIGKYMEIKKIKSLLLFGEMYDIAVDGGVKYYSYSNNGNDKLYNTKPANYDYTRQYYKIVPKTSNILDNPCYDILGKNGEKVSKINFDLNDIKIYVEETNEPKTSAYYLQTFVVDLPINAVPIQVATIEIDMQGEPLDYYTNVDKKTESTPLRIFYEVGIDESIFMKNSDGVDPDMIDKEYLEKNVKNGEISFYSNYYGQSIYTDYIENTGDYKTRGDAFVSFSPSKNNRYYIFQKKLNLYTNAYEVKKDGNLELIKNPSLFFGANYVGEYNGVTENNKATGNAVVQVKNDYNLGKIKEGDTITLSNDIIKYGTSSSSNKYYYIATDYYKGSDNGGELVKSLTPKLGAEFGSGILGDTIQKGEYLNWYDSSGKYEDIYGFEDKIPEAKLDGKWILATKIGGLRVGDLHQNVLNKTKNETNTSATNYLPIVANTKGQEASDIIFYTYLGNNGKLVYKIASLPVDNPNTGTFLSKIALLIFLIAFLIVCIVYNKYKKSNKIFKV